MHEKRIIEILSMGIVRAKRRQHRHLVVGITLALIALSIAIVATAIVDHRQSHSSITHAAKIAN